MQKSTGSILGSVDDRGPELERGSLARKLRELRVAAGLSQQLLGAALDRPQSYVSKIESAQRRVELVEIQDWARACGKAIQWTFVDADGEALNASTPTSEALDRPNAPGDLPGAVRWLLPRLTRSDRSLLESTIRYLMDRQDTERR